MSKKKPSEGGPGTAADDDDSDIPIFPGTTQTELSGGSDSLPTVIVQTDASKQAPMAKGSQVTSAYADATPRTWLEDLGELASGGMSVIHKVHHKNLRRTAAMKVLKPEFEGDLTNRRRFLEEAQITGQLDHPNIPPIYDLWIGDSGEVRFTMKLVQGQTLTDILKERTLAERSDRDWAELLNIYLKVCDALAFAHSYGVIHRDLKPDNVMVGTHGQVWLMDWGCAFLLPDRKPGDRTVSVERDPAKEVLDGEYTILGTASYMAPEQALARISEMDQLTDVYLLGGLLFAILTDSAPHSADSLPEAVLRAQRGEVDDPHRVAGEVKLPPELCRIALRALRPKRADRYQSVDALKEDLEKALRHGWWFDSVTFPVGAHVVKEGEIADAAYIITSGACEVYRLENGERVSLRKMGAGDTFGETAIFTQQTRTASVEVTEKMTATVITLEAFDRAMGESWMRSFVTGLAERFKEVDRRLSEMRTSETTTD